MNANWKDLAADIGKFAPVLGTLIAGPAGAEIGSIVAATLGVANTPDAVSQALTVNPDAAVKLREIESNERVKLQELLTQQATAQIAAQKQAITDVNTTMQTEAKAEHWPTYTWRPVIGFAFAFNMVASSLLTLAVFIGVAVGSTTAAAAVAMLPTILGALAALNGTALPILGIASYLRGKMQGNPETPTVQLPRGQKGQVSAATAVPASAGVPPNPFAQN